MKALSIRQPWAWAILHAGKDIENRKWNTNYRGRILIHAPNTFDFEGYDFITKDLKIKLPEYIKIPRNGIVGMTHLVNCVKQSNSSWFFGPFGFVLYKSQELPFMSVKGQLGFFEVNYDFSKLKI